MGVRPLIHWKILAEVRRGWGTKSTEWHISIRMLGKKRWSIPPILKAIFMNLMDTIMTRFTLFKVSLLL